MPEVTWCLVTLDNKVSKAAATLLAGSWDFEVIGGLYVTWYDSAVRGGTSGARLKALAPDINITATNNSSACDMDKQKKKVITLKPTLREKTSFQPQALFDEADEIEQEMLSSTGISSSSSSSRSSGSGDVEAVQRVETSPTRASGPSLDEIRQLIMNLPREDMMRLLAEKKDKENTKAREVSNELRQREMDMNNIVGQFTKSRTFFDSFAPPNYYKKNSNVFFVTIVFNDCQVPPEHRDDVFGWDTAKLVFLVFESLFNIVGHDEGSMSKLRTIFQPRVFTPMGERPDPTKKGPEWEMAAIRRIRSIEREFKYESQHTRGHAALHVHALITVHYEACFREYMHIDKDGIAHYLKLKGFKNPHVLPAALPADHETVRSYIEIPSHVKNEAEGAEEKRLGLKCPRIAGILRQESFPVDDRFPETVDDDDTDLEQTPSVGVKRHRSVIDPKEIMRVKK